MDQILCAKAQPCVSESSLELQCGDNKRGGRLYPGNPIRQYSARDNDGLAQSSDSSDVVRDGVEHN